MTPKPIFELEEEYTSAAHALDVYCNENDMDPLYDTNYLKLAIKKMEAYKELKRAECSEQKFESLHAPVINKQLQSLKGRLITLQLKEC